MNFILSFIISYFLIYIINIAINKIKQFIKLKKALKNSNFNFKIDNDFWEDLKNEDISTENNKW